MVPPAARSPEDASPPRRQQGGSPDASPPRRRRDASPDASPPRKRASAAASGGDSGAEGEAAKRQKLMSDGTVAGMVSGGRSAAQQSIAQRSAAGRGCRGGGEPWEDGGRLCMLSREPEKHAGLGAGTPSSAVYREPPL